MSFPINHAPTPNRRRVFTGLLLMAAVGCSSGTPTGDVSGTVLLDGTPLPNAIVTFTPVAGGRSTIGTTDAAGHYTLAFRGEAGALLGEHKVSITSDSGSQAASVVGEASSDSDAYEQQAMGRGSADYNNATAQELVPAEYNTNTTLSCNVESGDNVFDFDLKSN